MSRCGGPIWRITLGALPSVWHAGSGLVCGRASPLPSPPSLNLHARTRCPVHLQPGPPRRFLRLWPALSTRLQAPPPRMGSSSRFCLRALSRYDPPPPPSGCCSRSVILGRAHRAHCARWVLRAPSLTVLWVVRTCRTRITRSCMAGPMTSGACTTALCSTRSVWQGGRLWCVYVCAGGAAAMPVWVRCCACVNGLLCVWVWRGVGMADRVPVLHPVVQGTDSQCRVRSSDGRPAVFVCQRNRAVDTVTVGDSSGVASFCTPGPGISAAPWYDPPFFSPHTTRPRSLHGSPRTHNRRTTSLPSPACHHYPPPVCSAISDSLLLPRLSCWHHGHPVEPARFQWLDLRFVVARASWYPFPFRQPRCFWATRRGLA
jgi:hypothetical protein